MKKFILSISILLAAVSAGAVNGTFIQLNRSSTEKSVEDWQADLKQMAEIGIDTIMVQWSSEPPILYMEHATNAMPYITETYNVLETLFEANRETGLDVYLGLQNDPLYWSQIKSRDRVLRDFFLLRISRNERLQLALLDAFGGEERWVGYYIPDEIDDYSWRHGAKRPVIKRYVKHMCERLRANDAERKIAMSAFFRGRTAPTILADNLSDICADSGLDALLIQDGVGVGDPPVAYVPFYFKVLTEKWANLAVDQTPILDFVAAENLKDEAADDDAEMVDADPMDTVPRKTVDETADMEQDGEEDANAQPALPELWVVIEAFKQTSKDGEPFTAKPTSPTQMKKQLRHADEYFDNLVFFTFQDYMDPDLGEAGAKLFKLMKDINETK